MASCLSLVVRAALMVVSFSRNSATLLSAASALLVAALSSLRRARASCEVYMPTFNHPCRQ
eukprot:scaffold152281_cov28-Prasinocladus_malaysianus.AAC.1